MNDPLMQISFTQVPARQSHLPRSQSWKVIRGLNLCLSRFFPPDTAREPFPNLSVFNKDSCGLKNRSMAGPSQSVHLSIHQSIIHPSIQPHTYPPTYSFTQLLFKCLQCCQDKLDSGPAHIKCSITQSTQTIKAELHQARLEAPTALASRKSRQQFAFSWRQAKSQHLAERAG